MLISDFFRPESEYYREKCLYTHFDYVTKI